ncbi:MAG TPA: sodium/solute symporter [Candidatus Babeliaceae bacterium]|nr:sodium/solute symporter [Candidatus Babeliaceae bacterium]
MKPLDYIVLAGYFLIVFLIAGVFSKSQTSLKDYFLGSRNIPWWAASFSGIATIASAISYIGAVGLGFSSNFSFLQYRLALPLSLLIICVVILPFFYNLNLYSIYEYLEKRFGLGIRLLSSGLFVLFKCCFLAIGIYAPAIIIEVLTGSNTLLIILMTGLLTTIYTFLGGIKAVIWTDTLQLFILLGGIFVVIGTGISGVHGGFSEVFKVAREFDKFKYFNFSFHPTNTYTIWGGIIGGTFLMISQFGTDQSEMQRFLTVGSLRKARLALISSLLVTSILGFLIFFEGTVLFAFYHQKGNTAIASNQVFIKFIVEELPIGLRGFLIAAIFAAGMSTISSVLNSITAVVLTDFYNRFKKNEATVLFARMVTLILGIFSTLLACLGEYLGNILESATMIINFFGGSIVGVFLLGMLSRRAGRKGALIGFLSAFIAVLLVASFTRISFMWYSVIGVIITCVVGEIVSGVAGEEISIEQKALVYDLRRVIIKRSNH